MLVSSGNSTVYYNYDQEGSSNSATNQAPTSSVPQKTKSTAPAETTSVSSSFESNESMNSEEYTAMLDYLATAEGDADESHLGAMSMPLPAVHGMNMEDTELWAQSTPKLSSRSKRSTPKDDRATSSKSDQRTGQLQTRPPARSRNSSTPSPSPHSRSGSAFSTPMSWGKKDKKDKKGRSRPSPLSSQAMKQRYGLSFVVAIDPISKLVDDDALIVVPHNQAMAVAFAPSDVDHHAVEIILPPTTPPLDSRPDPTIMDVDVDVTSPTTLFFAPCDDDDEDDDDDDNGDEEESDELPDEHEDYQSEGDIDHSLDESPDFGDSSEESEEMEEDDGSSFESDGEYDILGEDDEEEDGEDSGNSDGDSSDDAGSEADELPQPPKPTLTAGLTMAVLEPSDLQSDGIARGVGFGNLPRKHDMRRMGKPAPRQRPEDDSAFMSPKKLSKTEKKKRKKRDRDEAPLEYHELQTWNGLIRDWIQHAAFGVPMPFSPMGKYQRKQLHWLSEFYGLRSQSFGSGTRRSTSVFVTKRTVLPDFGLSVAAIKAIHAGIHPFELTINELHQNSAEIEVPKRKNTNRARNTGTPRRGRKDLKNRSPLTTASSPAHKDKNSYNSSKKRRDKAAKQKRAREEAWEEEEEHHGLEFSITSTAKRLVGAGASHIPESNVGHTMLRKLGWTIGGLGREQQGIAHPIEAVIKAGRGGLGS